MNNHKNLLSRRQFMKAAGGGVAGLMFGLSGLSARRLAAQDASSNSSLTGTVTWVVWGSEDEFDRFLALGDVYKERFPNVDLQLRLIPSDQYDEALLTQFAGGTSPYTFHANEDQVLQFGLRQQLMPLESMLESDPSFGIDNFYPRLLEPATVQGTLYGIPVDDNPMVLYYNADLFASKGVPNPWELYEAGEWNWETYRETAAAVTDAETFGTHLDSWWGPIFPYFWQNGIEPFDPETYLTNLDQPEALETLEFLRTMIVEDRSMYYVPQGTQGAIGANTLFQSGRLGMYNAGRWMVPTYKDITDFAWDIVPLPKGKVEATSVPAAWQVVSVQTPEADLPAVWEWVKLFAGEEGQVFRMGGAGNAVPSWVGLEGVVEPAEGELPLHWREFLRPLEEGFGYGKPQGASLDNEAQNALFAGMDRILLDQGTPEEIMNEVVPEVNERLIAVREEFGL
jgi:multiple sugar transport system substrate-binding protein